MGQRETQEVMVIYIAPKNIPVPRAVSWGFWVTHFYGGYIRLGQYEIPVDAEAIALSLPDEMYAGKWFWNAIQADGGAFRGPWSFSMPESYYLMPDGRFLDGETYVLNMATGELSGKFGAPFPTYAAFGITNPPANAEFWTVTGSAGGKTVDSGPVALYATVSALTGAASLTFRAGKHVYDESGNLVGDTYVAVKSIQATLLAQSYIFDFATGLLGSVVPDVGSLPPPTGAVTSKAWLWGGGGLGLLWLLTRRTKSTTRTGA